MYELNEEDKEAFSPGNMRQWAAQELKDIAKAGELRAKEVNDLVSRYSSGEFTAAEAAERYFRYQDRWGEAIPGVSAGGDLSDETILTKMDEVRRMVEEARRTNRQSVRSR
jgi:hypothetical protein